MTNLYSRLSAGFPDPATPFAHLPDGSTITYHDVATRSAGFAHQLRAAGVGIGDRIAVQAEKSIDMLMLYLGALRAGAVFLPLNTAYTAGELDYFLRDAEPALVVCDPARLSSIVPLSTAAGVARVETLEALAAQAAAQPGVVDDVARDDGDLAAILYTSGTTGRSKGAMLSHDNLGSNAFMLKDAWRFTGDDVLLHALPIFHTHGLFVGTNTILAAGAAMIFLSKFDPKAVLAALPRATTMMGVPTFYIRLLDEPGFTRDLVAHIRLFISGSAPLSADIHREFRDRTGHAILERYGMTETNMTISNPYEGDRIAGTVGFPMPGVSIRIADPDTGAERPQGEVGVVEIAGPNVFQGYWRMPEKTAAEFRDGWFVSGDLGLVDARGYVSLVGRAKDLIISGGYNVYPAEVETALDELPQVHESAVIAVPHRELGEAPVAVIVPREPGFADGDLIREGLAGQLARYKQPRAILFVDALPKNAMGKVQKALLREEHKGILA